MDDDTLLNWLVLASLPECTAPVFRELLSLSNDPSAILASSDAAWRKCGASTTLRHARRDWTRGTDKHIQRTAEDALACLRRQRAVVVPMNGKHYPPLLAQIPDPPPLLYVSGEVSALSHPQMAIVGSRRCTSAGARAARQFAGELVGHGFSICSGMALGIDGAAHGAALAANGVTVAVTATGIDICYPRRHRQLAEAICERGALVTEFRPGTPPRPERFPMRNRLISGMSLGVLVVEADLRSGSLITARLALEQNREVFALPHSIYHAGGRGCNQLIRQGAKLTETLADILEELGTLCQAQRELLPKVQPAGELRAIWNQIGYQPVSVDELVAEGAGTVESVLSTLSELELGGFIEQSGGLYMRC